jgi:hypothetical protein
MSTGEVAELVGLIYNGMQSSSALALPRIVSASEVGARVLRLVPSDLLLVQEERLVFLFLLFLGQGID